MPAQSSQVSLFLKDVVDNMVRCPSESFVIIPELEVVGRNLCCWYSGISTIIDDGGPMCIFDPTRPKGFAVIGMDFKRAKIRVLGNLQYFRHEERFR